MKYAINGRFLTQRLTGVQRMEIELLKELDKLLLYEQNDIVIVAPSGYKKGVQLKNIRVVMFGKLKGIAWEQISFYHYLRKNDLIGINLGNVAPLLKPDIVCIHDVKFVKHPEWTRWKYVLWSRLHYWNALTRGSKVLTVSNFSKKEIEECYPKKRSQIYVLDEGWQHMREMKSDPETLKKYELTRGEYYFSLYQIMPNKNFKWIIKAAEHNPNELFVVSGWHNKKMNISDIDSKDVKKFKNIKVLGYIKDEEMKFLLENCKAFIFPSVYEGFGLPPLEALAVGAKVLVMDIPVMREVLGDSVQYIQNDNYSVEVDESIKADNALERHSWENGARKLMNVLDINISEDGEKL
ncbi:MAG: glycosyltransferase family 4 protein [Lachnospiraceae bacterium]|nr:glycosyltransferase family 4 protein [Lachnospiraceae bacterium]